RLPIPSPSPPSIAARPLACNEPATATRRLGPPCHRRRCYVNGSVHRVRRRGCRLGDGPLRTRLRRHHRPTHPAPTRERSTREQQPIITSSTTSRLPPRRGTPTWLASEKLRGPRSGRAEPAMVHLVPSLAAPPQAAH